MVYFKHSWKYVNSPSHLVKRKCHQYSVLNFVIFYFVSLQLRRHAVQTSFLVELETLASHQLGYVIVTSIARTELMSKDART